MTGLYLISEGCIFVANDPILEFEKLFKVKDSIYINIYGFIKQISLFLRRIVLDI